MKGWVCTWLRERQQILFTTLQTTCCVDYLKKKLEADFCYNSIIPLTSLFYGIKREVSCWVASPLYVVDREYRTCRCYNYFAPRFLSLVLCVVVGGLSDSDYYCIVPMTSSPLPHLRTNRSDIIPSIYLQYYYQYLLPPECVRTSRRELLRDDNWEKRR